MSRKILIAVIVIFSILIIGGLLYLLYIFSNASGYVEEPTPCLCEEDSMNCGDFATQEEAQACFEYCGGVGNDIHRLDADGNGLACEGLA